MAKAVKAGNRLVWGGEGKLSRYDGIGHFKRGAALIAIRAGAPVYPVVFFGGHNILPAGQLRMRKGVLRMHFGTPISTQGLTEDDARALADKLQAEAARIYETLRPHSA